MTSSHTLQARQLSLGYGEREIVSRLDLALPP